MPIDHRIALQGRVADPLNALASGYQLGNAVQQQPTVNAMNQQNLKTAQTQGKTADLKMREALRDSRVKAMTMGAYELSTQPVEQWGNILQQRITDGARYGYDAEAEKEALDMLQKDPAGLKQQVDGLVKFGTAAGLFGKTQNNRSVALAPGGQLYGSNGALLAENTNATAAQEQARLASQQNAALAALIGGRQQNGAMPPPNAIGSPTSPFAGMSDDQLRMLPPDVLKKELERSTDPKQLDYTEQQGKKKEFQERAVSLLGGLLGNPGGVKSAVGTIDSKTPTLFPSTAEAENKIAQLRSILTADNLKLMTGVLSETDMKVLREISAGQLDTNRDQNEFMKDLNALYNKLSGMGGPVDRSGASYDLEYDPATGSFR